MRAYKQLVNGEYVVPNLKCYQKMKYNNTQLRANLIANG